MIIHYVTLGAFQKYSTVSHYILVISIKEERNDSMCYTVFMLQNVPCIFVEKRYD